MRNHRTKDRRKPFRTGISGDATGFSVTFQNNRFGWIGIEGQLPVIAFLGPYPQITWFHNKFMPAGAILFDVRTIGQVLGGWTRFAFVSFCPVPLDIDVQRLSTFLDFRSRLWAE
jgi:hypothetical protein